MKKSLIVVVAVVLVAVSALGAWYVYTQSGPALPNPRSLVPPTVDLYVEAASFDRIDTTLAQVAAALDLPYNRADLAGRMTGAPAVFVQDPDAAGLDRTRMMGYAGTGLGTSTWIGVAFIPIRDADAAAKALKTEAKALRAGPVSTDAGWAALLDGYLVVSGSDSAVRDLLALTRRGITVAAHDTDALVTVYIMPKVLRDASAYLKSPGTGEIPGATGAGGAARVITSIASDMLESVDAIRAELHWGSAGFRLRTAFQMKPGSPALNALGAPTPHPPHPNHRPPRGRYGGGRGETAGARAIGERVLESIRPLLPDSAALDILAAGLDLVAEESALSFLEWNVREPGRIRTVAVQTLPSGREDQYATLQMTLRKKGAEIWETMMKGSGHPTSTMTFIDLPGENYDSIPISGLETRTSLEIEPIPNANAETLRMLENLKDQRMVERYARVSAASGAPGSAGADEKADYWVSAAGNDTVTIREQIDRVRASFAGSGGDEAGSAAGHPAVKRVIAMFAGGTAAYAIIDPTAMNATEPSLTGAFGITCGVKEEELRVDLVWPREHLAVIPQIIMGMMMGGMGGGGGAGPGMGPGM
jgi:hypothetical protein